MKHSNSSPETQTSVDPQKQEVTPHIHAQLQAKGLPLRAVILVDTSYGEIEHGCLKVKILILPSNTTSLIQLMDPIAALKKRGRIIEA